MFTMEHFINMYQDVSLASLISWGCSIAMMFGGVIPYVPQYRDIKSTENVEGFSTYVCLTLLVANTLRILFWFGHQFEVPLLLQSIIMNVVMLRMIHLCVQVQNRTQIIPGRSHTFTDFDVNFFWEWTDFQSYLEFMATFTGLVGILMYFYLDVPIVVETIGFLAVFTEAMLGAPQFCHNLRKKSTVGMSKKMVLLWTMGDLFKTCYFILREAPVQFWVCGILQVSIDFAILLQIVIYRRVSSPVTVFLKKGEHGS